MKRQTVLHLPRTEYLWWAVKSASATVALTILVALLSEGSFAQATRSIRLVIPYAAGGINEAMTRLLASAGLVARPS
jgi:tripartite-type tricarboxylate transporter receptor subunit TctC